MPPTDAKDILNPPPTRLWVGKKAGEWVVYAFTNEAHVRDFLEVAPTRRRAWAVEGFTLTEVELGPAVERVIRPRDATREGADRATD
jgi:hypothetical protein